MTPPFWPRLVSFSRASGGLWTWLHEGGGAGGWFRRLNLFWHDAARRLRDGYVGVRWTMEDGRRVVGP